jgi:DNA mismatch endonuclease (patch repair protein)
MPGNRRRRIDIAFPGLRIAVFVDGCFWHGCPEHGTDPQTNPEWWQWKFARIRARDTDTTRHLTGVNWLVLRFWEHEDPAECAQVVQATVAKRRQAVR